jgi:hypothetical protein
MATATIPQSMSEPPDRAYVVLKDPAGKAAGVFFERDDSVMLEPHQDSWYDGRGDAWTWPEIENYAREVGREIHRLYLREDLPLSVVTALDAAEQSVVGG